jgi:hypothetical protein
MKVKVAILVVTFALLPLANALAEVPSVCDQYTGKAKGICISASKGVKCGQPDQMASPQACQNLEAQFRETGAGEPPWLISCPAECMQYFEETLLLTTAKDPPFDTAWCHEEEIEDWSGTHLVFEWTDPQWGYVTDWARISISVSAPPFEVWFACEGIAYFDGGVVNSYWSSVTPTELGNACSAEIKSIAAGYGVICQEPVVP